MYSFGVLKPVQRVWRGGHMPVINNSGDTKRMSYNLIQFGHHLLKNRTRFHRLRTKSYKAVQPNHFKLWLQAWVVTCASESTTGYRSEVPMIPSLGLLNLLGGSLNSGNASLDHWFVMKIYNSGTARWKKCKGHGMGKGFSPVKPHALYLHVFINLEAL